MGNSAIGRGTAIEENKVKASSGAVANFLDGIVDNSTIQIVANQLVAPGINFMATSGFNIDAASVGATTSISGIGFTPKYAIFTGLRDTFVNAFWGMSDGTPGNDDGWGTNYLGVPDNYGRFSQAIVMYNTAANYINGTTAFDVDGFTVTWTKNGSPTGTLFTQYMLFG